MEVFVAWKIYNLDNIKKVSGGQKLQNKGQLFYKGKIIVLLNIIN